MLSDSASNILNIWHRASAADLASGLDWYARAQELADSLAAGTPFTREQTAAVIAALSPRVSWPVNADGARAMVEAAAAGAPRPMTAGFEVNREKAWQILHHDGDPLDILHGPKVTSFYHNILGSLDMVTIDVWAARAAGVDRDRFTPHQYEQVADAYREAAATLDIAPRDLQAAVWTAIRRIQLSESLRHGWILQREEA